MRLSIALFAVGEVTVLGGITGWSWQLAAVLFGVQCVGLGLLRESRADRPAVRKPAPGVHRGPRRRTADRLRGGLRLIRGGVAS